MKRFFMISIKIVIVILFLFGVFKFFSPINRRDIKTAETKSFIKSIIKSNNYIEKVKIYSQSGGLYFSYTINKEPGKEELSNIFNTTYNFLMNDYKLKDIIFNDERDVSIYINYKNDRYEYNSQRFINDKIDNSIQYTDNYRNWILFKNNVKVDTITKDN